MAMVLEVCSLSFQKRPYFEQRLRNVAKVEKWFLQKNMPIRPTFIGMSAVLFLHAIASLVASACRIISIWLDPRAKDAIFYQVGSNLCGNHQR
jgi:hypothetical protein